jgi:K+ transporter
MILVKFIEKQWLAVIITALWLLSILHYQEENSVLLKETKQLEVEIAKLKKKDIQSSIKIDSLSKIDTVIVNRIKTIKQKEYVQIKVIDSLPISGLQQYFTDNYKR